MPRFFACYSDDGTVSGLKVQHHNRLPIGELPTPRIMGDAPNWTNINAIPPIHRDKVVFVEAEEKYYLPEEWIEITEEEYNSMSGRLVIPGAGSSTARNRRRFIKNIITGKPKDRG